MKLEKNKIVFAAIIVCVVLFIGAYSMLVLGDDEEPTLDGNQIPVPELKGEQQEYESKLEALDALKEVRETNAPSIYDERLLDSAGVYNPDLLDKEKMRIVDSIYNEGRISYSDRSYRRQKVDNPVAIRNIDTVVVFQEKEPSIEVKELGLEHQLFFASAPVKNDALVSEKYTDAMLYAVVNRTQVVKKDFRLELRLTQPAVVNGRKLPKHTRVYGFVSFKPNRLMLTIEHINHLPVKLRAYDWQDGSEGIYIENSFRAEARQEVVGDIVDDINIVGVPQVSGIKRIFQRNNRNVKVTIADNYKLILKLKQ